MDLKMVLDNFQFRELRMFAFQISRKYLLRDFTEKFKLLSVVMRLLAPGNLIRCLF